MTRKPIFDTMEYMNGCMRRIIAGGLTGIAIFFIVGAFFSAMAADPPRAAANAAANGSDLYTARYLPDILEGAQGPGEMVFLIYQYLMGLVGIVAVGVIIYGGVLRTVSADPGKIKVSNDYIKNALKGIVLLFGAQVIFNTINPNIIDIARIQKALQPTEKITPRQFQETAIAFTDTEAAAGAQEWAGESVLERVRFGGDVISENNAADRLNAIGGGTLVKGCESQSQISASCLCTAEERPRGKKANGTGCVSFVGAKDKTMKEIVGLGKALGSGLIVTSVTDGHGTAGLTGSAHNTGDKFDIRPLDSVTNYIKSNFTKLSLGTDWMDPQPRTPKLERYQNPKTGAIYVLETNRPGRGAHWDVDTRPNAPAAEEG